MDFLSNKYVFSGLVIGLIIIGGFYIWFDLNIGGKTPNPTPAPPQGTPEININPPQATGPNIPVPPLPWPVSIKNGLSGEAATSALKNIETLTAELKKDPSVFPRWMDLALYRRSIGDFIGARDAWIYAAALRPNDFIAPHNLGDLYTYDIIDYKKAEGYYLSSLKLEPTATMVYQKLYELYRFKMKNDTRARAILKEGISKNPKDALRLEYILDEWDNPR